MIRFIGLAWILGIALMGNTASWLNILQGGLWWLGALLPCILYLYLWCSSKLQQQFFLKWIAVIVASTSFFALGWQFSHHHLKQRLSIQVTEKQVIEGIIYIDQISEGKLESWRQTGQLLLPEQNKTLQILLYPKKNYDAQGEVIGFTTEQFELGKFYQATLEIKPPHGYANPGGFDQEKWLLQENIQGTAIVRFSRPMTEQQITALGWSQFVIDQKSLLKRWQLKTEQLRQQYRKHLLKEDYQQQHGLLLGLLTGDRSGISYETALLYQKMGISHLLAISGPHVLILATLITSMLMWILHFFMRRGRWAHLYLYIPKQRFYLPIFIVIVTFYVAFTGFEIPALRTWWMVLIISLCMWMRWQVSTFSLLIVVASLVLWMDCFSILSAAFWLSFGASAILLLIYQNIVNKKVEGYQSHLDQFKAMLALLWQSQWRIFIALLPIVLWQFQAVSLISPIINLIAIPFLSLVIVPLDIIAATLWQIIPFMGQLIWWFAGILITIFNTILVAIEPIAEFLYIPSRLSSLELMALSFALIILSLPKGIIHYVWAWLFLLVFILPHPKQFFKMNVLDVGQGQAIMVQTHQHKLLIDAGMGSPQNHRFSMGAQVIVPFLYQQGIKQLEEVLLSHLDADHSGGFSAVIEQIKIKQVRSNVLDNKKIDIGQIPFIRCEQQQTWLWDDVRFKILWPLAQASRKDANESSCVVLIEVPLQSKTLKILVMGDAGWEAEFYLLKYYPDLKADILILGHHGSKYSSAYDFLRQVDPQIAISSSGIDNRYGHPTPQVLLRLQDLGIAHLDTSFTGNIQVQVDPAQSAWYWSIYRGTKLWHMPKHQLALPVFKRADNF